ncbi:xanthine dehydrogenase family protein molybdopterin-binding subunit [Bradyrhizobium sp. LHD-71]|uniref:xanthine dehydrogenase family protein molybdopterin-binding subunit n=1 Tax=Bradyrhizobium sp. LHD-71 TaxID=3072141 RepID=UPI00280FB10F|nr:xanthine dehydrogenase family protein molybdopterin-binding subunit [Bradyrhizobium sp. LHD-71]MDQ8730954.1 xanthine dehydrogenase family protein molybdopterin-binding subunit [Bradyrhizobium sp. LHD-71]
MQDIKYGRVVHRREDFRLTQGRGLYAGDVALKNVNHVVFVRSPHAHARIDAIDTVAARQATDVVAVFTAADLDADGVRDYNLPTKLQRPGGVEVTETPRPPLVRDRVRFLGEPVAMVIAKSLDAARDAAELVDVTYQAFPAAATVAEATADRAPAVWEMMPDNVAYHWSKGDAADVERALKDSHHVARLVSISTRVSANPMEPRSAVGYVDKDGRPTLHVSYQSPHNLRDALAAMFGMEKTALRVVATDVGGSFGMKSGLVREESIVFWAAKKLRLPVKWVADRSEAFLADEHARDIEIDAALGLDKRGHFTALSVSYRVNIGAYLSARSISPIGNFGGIAGVYRTPKILGQATGIFTHTTPTAPYRGAGRPDATYAIERLIDVAAQEMNIDPFDLRRRNLIPPEAMPYKTPFVFTYDCGDFIKGMERAAELAGYKDFAARRKEAKKRGKLRGIGIANPIEVAAGPFARPATDFAWIEAKADGSVRLRAGAMSVGQGLETSFSDIVAQRLGVPIETIDYVYGDTDQVQRGKGNGGSAALTLGGSAVSISIDKLLEQGKQLAANRLEAAVADIEFADGRFRIAGTDRSLSLAEVAALTGNDEGLTGAGDFKLAQPTYPNGCHICEVEIDPDTGRVEVIGYVGVEDVGRVLHPQFVEGQIHGGVAQGMGQVLQEVIAHEPGTGQLLTGSFMDYAMPRANDLPSFTCDNVEVPTALNPLGVKGVGEAGTVGALAATMNAICNALAGVGVRHLDMPATPERVWRAIHSGARST